MVMKRKRPPLIYNLEETLVALCLQRRKETPIEAGRRKVESLLMYLGNGHYKRLFGSRTTVL
jgi:hypothetical protein